MRRRRSLLLLIPVLVAAGFALAGRGPAPGELSPVPPAKAERADKRVGAGGAVQVVDGDTLRIGAARIRLHGIDAPERAELR